MQLQETLKQLTSPPSNANTLPIQTVLILLLLAGVLSLFVRFLFRRFSATASSTDSISRVFPLLTIITTAMIAVLQSSPLAVSLGLVGTLSIIRFRSAIKDPEELVYLFFCISLGLALGGNQVLIAIVLVAVGSVFVFAMHQFARAYKEQSLLLTITGDAARHFSRNESEVLDAVEQVAGSYVLQRYDIEDGRGQVRLILAPDSEKRTKEIISQLRERLSDCEMSYVNMHSTI